MRIHFEGGVEEFLCAKRIAESHVPQCFRIIFFFHPRGLHFPSVKSLWFDTSVLEVSWQCHHPPQMKQSKV